MSNTEQSMLYPFRLSPTRMRQSAVQLRRQGQVLEALSLIRRAAEQEDTPQAWLNVAAELRQLGCWEAAVPLLGRAAASPVPPVGVWVEMARCLRALGQYPLALDCVYHQLHDDPWSPEGDAARDILLELEDGSDEKEPRRVPQLVRRGLSAWNAGDRETGERRIRRALKLVKDRERLLSTAAMMCMLHMDLDGALHYLTRALRHDPDDARTLIALSTLLYQMGRPRIARGFLAKAAVTCETVTGEDAFLTAAWAQDAWPQLDAFLQARMKAWPRRIPLLHARANMLAETGFVSVARETWREILAIDPDDRLAAAMLTVSRDGAVDRLLPPGATPVQEKRRQQKELRLLIESGEPLHRLLAPGSRSRRLIDWAFTSADKEENRLARTLLSQQDDEALLPYLRGHLASPFLTLEMRQWALIRLAQLGFMEEMVMPAGEHYTLVQCQKVDHTKKRSPWRTFLPALLQETRQYRQGAEIAAFAASLWAGMSPAQRAQAAGSGCYAWCKATETLYLLVNGHGEKAARVARSTALTPRKISRVLRRLAACIRPE